MTEDFTPLSNLKFLDVESEQANSSEAEPDNLSFLDDDNIAKSGAEKEERERGFLTDAESEEIESVEEWRTRESLELDQKIKANDRRSHRERLESQGEKVPEHLKEPLTEKDLKNAPDLTSGDAPIDSMSDEDFAKGIARLQGEVKGDDDRSGSQVFAGKALAADAQIAALEPDLDETYENYSPEEMQEALEFDENLQKYNTAIQARNENFVYAMQADQSEHKKIEPDHDEARAFLTEQLKAEFKARAPLESDARIQQRIDREEYNLGARAGAVGASPAAEIHRMALRYGFTSKQERADLHAIENTPFDKMTARQQGLVGFSIRGAIGKNFDKMSNREKDAYFHGLRAKEKGLEEESVEDLFKAIGG